MRDGLMPREQPEAAIAGKKHQSIRSLDTRILKITTQTHRPFKRQFIQRFLRICQFASGPTVATMRLVRMNISTLTAQRAPYTLVSRNLTGR
jgi:predicted GTPase